MMNILNYFPAFETSLNRLEYLTTLQQVKYIHKFYRRWKLKTYKIVPRIGLCLNQRVSTGDQNGQKYSTDEKRRLEMHTPIYDPNSDDKSRVIAYKVINLPPIGTVSQKYKCATCDYTDSQSEALVSHSTSHITNPRCPICFKHLPNTAIMQNHISHVHNSETTQDPDSDSENVDYKGIIEQIVRKGVNETYFQADKICQNADAKVVQDVLGILEGLNIVATLSDSYYQWIGASGLQKLIELKSNKDRAVDPNTQYGQLSRFVLEYILQIREIDQGSISANKLRKDITSSLSLNEKYNKFIKSKVLRILENFSLIVPNLVEEVEEISWKGYSGVEKFISESIKTKV